MNRNPGTQSAAAPRRPIVPAFAFAVTFLLALVVYRGSFAAGFLDEDFAWLRWAARTPPRQALLPNAHVYYRPLSSNLPYYLLAGSRAGVFTWKLLALALGALAATLIRPGGASGRHQLLAWGLGLVWLLAPFGTFPFYYLNALDYVLYPALTLAFFHALRAGRHGVALAAFLAALLSKEQALGFLLAPFLLATRSPRWYLGASLLAAAAYLAAHGGFFSAGPIAAGYAVSFRASDWLRQGASLARSLAFGALHPGWDEAWHAGAWLSTGVVFVSLGGERRRLLRPASMLLALYLPLLLLPGLKGSYLGCTFWALLLFFVAEAAAALPEKALCRATLLVAAVAAADLALAAHFLPGVSRFYQERSRLYESLQESAEPLLARCNRADRVVVRGLESALPGIDDAKWGLWALRARHPETRFYLERPAGSEMRDPLEPYLWVDEAQTRGHPVLTVRRSGPDFFVSGRGDPGCGIP